MFELEMQSPQLFHMLRAAIAGAEAIRQTRKDGFNVKHKDDNSPVTDADYAADRAIREALAPTGLPILSEEVEVSKSQRQSWQAFWCVDPLDGTREFAAGRDEFAVCIARIDGLTPTEGAIALPATRMLYFTRNGKSWRVKWSRQAELEDLIIEADLMPGPDFTQPWVATVSRAYMDANTAAYLDQLRDEQPNLKVLPSGSALKFCKLMEGKAHIYPRFAPCMEWDTAAGHALMHGIGMEIFASGGHPLTYNKDSLFNPDFIVRQR